MIKLHITQNKSTITGKPFTTVKVTDFKDKEGDAGEYSIEIDTDTFRAEFEDFVMELKDNYSKKEQ